MSPARAAAHKKIPQRQAGGRLIRILSLVRKESYQIIRDPSSILIAFILPMLLMLLFGYGVSLDLNNISLGIAVESRSPATKRLVHSFQNSRYFKVKKAQDRRIWNPCYGVVS